MSKRKSRRRKRKGLPRSKKPTAASLPPWKIFLEENPDPRMGPCPGKHRTYTAEEFRRRREMFREKGPDGKVCR
jgi:hypothetical protein